MKPRRISARAILFDWDGTLLDSFRADARAYQAMFRALEIPWTRRDLARHYSPDWYRVYEAARIPRDKWELADNLWGRAYEKENPRLLPGVRKMLAKLRRDFVLGLVTSGDAKQCVVSFVNLSSPSFLARAFTRKMRRAASRIPRRSNTQCTA